MTLREKVEQMQPDCVNEDYGGGVKGCPSDYSYLLNESLFRYSIGCHSFKNCAECWNQLFVDTMSTEAKLNEIK